MMTKAAIASLLLLQAFPAPPPATCTARLAEAAREYVDAAFVEPTTLVFYTSCRPQSVLAIACCDSNGCGGCPETPIEKVARLKCELQKTEEEVTASMKARDFEAKKAEAFRKLKSAVDACVPKAKP